MFFLSNFGKNSGKYLNNYLYKLNYTVKDIDFSNYYNFINDLDSFSDSFMENIIKSYFEYIDECLLCFIHFKIM